VRVLIEQAALHKAIGRVAPVVQRKNVIPVLDNILMVAGDDGLSLTANDMAMESVIRVSATIERPGRTTINAVTLSDLVRNAPAGAEIFIEAESELRARIQFGTFKTGIAALPADLFPRRNEDAFPDRLTLPCSDLRTILERSVFAATTDETRYFMQGVYLHMIADEGRPWLRAVGVSTTRTAWAQAPRDPGGPVFPAARLPRKAVAEFMRALDGRTDLAELAISRSTARLTVADLTLTTSLMDGDYPDYARPFAAEWATEATFDRQALIGAITRVSSLSDGKERGVRLSLSQGELIISLRNTNGETAEERIAATQSGPDFSSGFNGRNLIEALNQSELTTLRLNISDDKGPLCLRPPADDPEALEFLSILGTMAVQG